MTQKINEPSAFKSRITDWPVDERPRERLIAKGAESISNAELIAILLGQGSTTENAVDLARKLLRHFGSLPALSRTSLSELQQIKGIGPAKAVTLKAAFQLYRNLQKEQADQEIPSFRNPADVAKIYQPVIGHLEQETFWVILLDNQMKRIFDFEVTRGLIDSSLVHPREVFNQAVRHMAKGLIAMHNHPTGNLQPSENDLKITRRLVESGQVLDIPLYDHLIITRDGFYSFREHGQIG